MVHFGKKDGKKKGFDGELRDPFTSGKSDDKGFDLDRKNSKKKGKSPFGPLF